MGNVVGGSNIGIDLAKSQDIPGVFRKDIIQPFYGLKSGSFIDYIEDKASIDVHNINKNGIVEIGILVFL